MTTQPQNWFRHNEAADYCRISPRTLRRWRDAGRIRAYGGKYFRDDLDRAVRNEEPAYDNGGLQPRDVVRVNLMTGQREKIIGFPIPPGAQAKPADGETHTMHRVTGENFLSGWPSLGARQAMASELEIEQAQTQLVASGLDPVAASVLIQNAIELSRVSLFSFRGALEDLRSTAEERERRTKLQQTFGVGFSEPQQHTGTNYITQVMNAVPLCPCTVDETTAVVVNPQCLVHGDGTFKSAVPDCPFFLGTGKCATGCQGPDGPACWEPAEDPEPMFEDPPTAPDKYDRDESDWDDWIPDK